MNREEFEAKYAQKYMGLSFVHNPTEAIESIKELRDGEGYTDHHIDLCWKIQQIKNCTGVFDRFGRVTELEWQPCSQIYGAITARFMSGVKGWNGRFIQRVKKCVIVTRQAARGLLKIPTALFMVQKLREKEKILKTKKSKIKSASVIQRACFMMRCAE